MVTTLAISVTARKARIGDVILIYGFLQDPETPPYVAKGIKVGLLVDGNVVDQTVTADNGSYFFIVKIPEPQPIAALASGNHIISTVAGTPFGVVSSEGLTLTIGTEYKPISNSDINDFPTLEDELERPHSLIIDAEHHVWDKQPFGHTAPGNNWLFYGFLKIREEMVAIQGGFSAPPGRPSARVSFTRSSGESYRITAPFKALKIGSEMPGVPYPAIYVDDPNCKLQMGQAIDLSTTPPTYYIRTQNLANTFSLDLKLEGVSTPYWVARGVRKLFTGPTFPPLTWGGYAPLTIATGVLKTPQTGELNVKGMIAIDREWHAVIQGLPQKLQSRYTALVGYQPNFMFVTWHDYWLEGKYPWTRSGKLWFPTVGRVFQFDDFELALGGTPGQHADWYKLNGSFGIDGRVDLHGDVIIRHKGGFQPVVHWTGTVSGEGQELSVDAYGMGEVPRKVFFKPSCAIATATYGTPLAPQLYKLRQFRDRCLPSELANLYYSASPPIAKKIEEHPKLKLMTRKILDIFL